PSHFSRLEDPLTFSPRPRHLTAARRLSLALSLVALAVALALPAGAPAQTHKASHAHRAVCPASSKAHAKHPTHACTQSKHKGKAHHSAKHAVKKPAPPAASGHVPATCADGSGPARSRSGSFACDDGSEPACEDGSDPTRSSNGSTLLCPAPPQGNLETGCEDPSNPECTFGGSADEAICEEDSSPTSSEDGSTLLCEPATASGGND
ncbi:MAG TPA: hypothetical protein VES97_01545, partial [Solirubrobacteraceae bacterium]|nr:hypothetical protein [Solirubrobacteraceae bacterium]